MAEEVKEWTGAVGKGESRFPNIETARLFCNEAELTDGIQLDCYHMLYPEIDVTDFIHRTIGYPGFQPKPEHLAELQEALDSFIRKVGYQYFEPTGKVIKLK
jgi:hypothetical protein